MGFELVSIFILLCNSGNGDGYTVLYPYCQYWQSPIGGLSLGQSVSDFSSESFPIPLPCEATIEELNFKLTSAYDKGNQILSLQASALLEAENTELIREHFRSWGFSRLHFVGPDRNGYAMVIALRDEMVLIVHRGTRSVIDIIRDIEFIPGKLNRIDGLDGSVHGGLETIYRKT